MNEWRQIIIMVCTVLLAFAALATLMQSGLNAMRTDMNVQHTSTRADMRAEHAAMGAEHAAIREQLNSVDLSTARIEGHLFGIEIQPEPIDGE